MHVDNAIDGQSDDDGEDNDITCMQECNDDDRDDDAADDDDADDGDESEDVVDAEANSVRSVDASPWLGC
jgi:hypothetical protein